MANCGSFRLWVDPYYDAQTGPCEGRLLELSVNLAPTLALPETRVFDALVHLQQNALEKLEAREYQKTEGKLKLKLRLTRNLQQLMKGKAKASVHVELPVSASGKDLLGHVSALLEVEPEALKAIAGGKVLEGEALLTSQVRCNIVPFLTCRYMCTV